MAKRQSFDITLCSDDYILARNGAGVPQIQLGSSPNEPGFKSQVGSIRIDTFAGGMGEVISRTNQRYNKSNKANPTIDGMLLPLGNTNYANTTGTTNAYSSSAYSYGAIIPWESTFIIIYPRGIYSFDPDAALPVTVTVRLAAGAGFYFTGSWARHGDFFYFGRATDTTDVSVACGTWQISTGIAGTYAITGPVASYMYAFGNKIWYITNNAVGTPHGVFWTDADYYDGVTDNRWELTGGAAGTLRTLNTIKSTAKVTWLTVLGPYTIYFLDDSTFNTIDVDGVFAPLTKDEFAAIGGKDVYFGHPIEQLMGGLLIPYKYGFLWIEDIDTFRNFPTPQVYYEWPSGIQCFDAIGDEVFMMNRPGNNDINLYYMRFNERTPIWHQLTWQSTESSFISAAAMKIWRKTSNGQLRLWIIGKAGTTTGTLQCIELASPNACITSSQSQPYFITPFYLGDSISAPFADMVTKRFIRIRGYVVQNDAPSGGYIYLQYKVDGTLDSGFSNIASPSYIQTAGSGFFAAELPKTSASLGRACALEIDWINVDTSSAPYLRLPLFIDFEYVPSEDDIITLPIVASIDENKGTNARRNKHTVENVMTTIQGIVGTIVTLKIFEGGQTWTVLVQDYNMNMTADNIILNQGEAIIEVRCRRIA